MKHLKFQNFVVLLALLPCVVLTVNAQAFRIPCRKEYFDDQKVGELKLSDGKIIRYQYRNDNRWCNFHNDKKNLHYNGKLHYIKFYARDYNVRISNYRIKAKRNKDDDWQAGIDIEHLGQQIDVVCEWFGISTEKAQLIISIDKKKNR